MAWAAPFGPASLGGTASSLCPFRGFWMGSLNSRQIDRPDEHHDQGAARSALDEHRLCDESDVARGRASTARGPRCAC